MAFYRVSPGGLTLNVRVTPKASRDQVNGIISMPPGFKGGGPALKVSVTAPPDKGKANQAVCDLLAHKLGLPKTAVTVMSGHTDRRKVVHAAGDPAALSALVKQWISE